MLGKNNTKSTNEVEFDDTFKHQTQNATNIYKPAPVVQERDIYEELGLPNLPPVMPVLQSQNNSVKAYPATSFPNYQPNYQSKYLQNN